MISPVQFFLNRASRKILKEIRSQISRTTSTANSDTISQQDNKFTISLNPKDRHVNTKWSEVNKQNNIRALSTIQNKAKPTTVSSTVFSKEASREFTAIFPDIVRDLTEACRYSDFPEAAKRFSKVLQYNIPNGKKTRGLSTVIAYKMLEKPENLTPENVRLCNILGWCVELLKGYSIVINDIIDKSEIRRDDLCWYKNKEVGLRAIYDTTLLESGVYSILKRYFQHYPAYKLILELFQDVTLKSTIGKSLDGDITNGGNPDLNKFTMKNYNLIMKYRTGYYSFQLPVRAAMYFAKMCDPEQHRQAKTILLELGQFFQVQKDFMNIFGTSNIEGQLGSDINEGKCSWLAVVALQRANAKQRKYMEKYYGRPGEEAVEAIKDLYIHLGLPATYAAYEEESYKMIHTHIQQISKGLPHELFFTLVDKLYAFDG